MNNTPKQLYLQLKWHFKGIDKLLKTDVFSFHDADKVRMALIDLLHTADITFSIVGTGILVLYAYMNVLFKTENL